MGYPLICLLFLFFSLFFGGGRCWPALNDYLLSSPARVQLTDERWLTVESWIEANRATAVAAAAKGEAIVAPLSSRNVSGMIEKYAFVSDG